MAKPVSISLKAFTSSVQAAVKVAVSKHPKFNLPVPERISVSYLIRGIPVPEEIAKRATLAETQAFAADVAAHLATAHPDVARQITPGGTVLSIGSHVIIGIPAPSEIIQVEF